MNYNPHSTSSNHKKQSFQPEQMHHKFISHSEVENHIKTVDCSKYEQITSLYLPLLL